MKIVRPNLDLACFRVRRLGAAGAIGALLLVGALLVQAWLVHAAQGRIDRLRVEHAALRAKVAAGASAPTAVDRLAGFYARLRPPAAADAARTPLEVIHALAREQGVRLARGDYRSSRESGDRVIRHQFTLPVKAPYPLLHAWLARVMDAFPGATIDGLSLKREKVGNEMIEAQLRLVVYLSAD